MIFHFEFEVGDSVFYVGNDSYMKGWLGRVRVVDKNDPRLTYQVEWVTGRRWELAEDLIAEEPCEIPL